MSVAIGMVGSINESIQLRRKEMLTLTFVAFGVVVAIGLSIYAIVTYGNRDAVNFAWRSLNCTLCLAIGGAFA